MGKEEEGQLKRAYTYDFEKYYLEGSIDIYIAVKEYKFISQSCVIVE